MECADKGYAALSIAQIAKRAKVSTATIYTEYPDRDALLVAAMEMLFGILAADVIEVPPADNPQDRVEQLLVAHGQVYAQPLAVWFFRLHVMLAWSGHDHLRSMGKFVFEGIDAFWRDFLMGLEEEGHLAGIDPDLVVPMLLGPIERCTIIARLGCGDDDVGYPDLADAAHHAAQTLFALWGSEAWHARHGKTGAMQVRPDNGNLASAAASLLAMAPFEPGETEHIGAATRAATPKAQRERILHAAITLCQERGYGAASMHDIAMVSGASTATIYRHYADKADLFSSALESEFERHGPFEPPATNSLAEGLWRIGVRAADPDWRWMHNIIMASEISGTPRIVAIAQRHRAVTEDYVAALLAALPEAWPCADATRALIINFLLGPVERSGLLTLILFGKDAVDIPLLARISAFARDVHGRLASGREQGARAS